MIQTIDTFCRANVGISILLCILLTFCALGVLHVWCKMADYCGLLYKQGWKKFRARWKTWSIIKKVSFIVMYLCTILGWAILGAFMCIIALFSAYVITDHVVNKGK